MEKSLSGKRDIYILCVHTHIELSLAFQPNKNQLGCFNYSKPVITTQKINQIM